MAERVHLTGDPERPTRIMEDPIEIANPILGFFLGYWRDNRQGNALPQYARFVPREIKKHLPWVVVTDALPEYEDFRYRVVGTHVTRYFLGDGTGKTIRQAFAGEDASVAESLVWLHRRACVERIPIRLTGPATVLKNIYFPSYDSIYLPYATGGETAGKIVNVFTFDYREIAETRETPLATAVL